MNHAGIRAVMLFGLLMLIVGCGGDRTDYTDALDEAGANRGELKLCLSHWSDGSEEQNAMQWLVANMIWHGAERLELTGTQKEFFDAMSVMYDSAFVMGVKSPVPHKKDREQWCRALALQFDSIGLPQREPMLPDSRILKAEYLIDNVAMACSLWRSGPYAAMLSREDFYEMLLPYRTVAEPLPSGKKELSARFGSRLLPSGVTTVDAAGVVEAYKQFVAQMRWLSRYTTFDSHIGENDLFIPKFKNDCHNIAAITCNILRSLGIPAVYEYTPMWQDRTRRHYWCAVLDNDGVLRPFTPPDNVLMGDWDSDLKYAGKVYRSCFGRQSEAPVAIAGDGEYVPDNMRSPVMSDQTYRYHPTVTLRLPYDKGPEGKLAYLCFFDRNNAGLTPVGWGRIDHRNHTVTYEQVPLDVLFFPVYYEDESPVVMGAPFCLASSGDVGWLPKPHTQRLNERKEAVELMVVDGELKFAASGRKVDKDKDNVEFRTFIPKGVAGPMRLTRKYPEKRSLKRTAGEMVGAVVIGADANGGRWDTLGVIRSHPRPFLQDVELDKKGTYRYFRLAGVNGHAVNVAHLEFLACGVSGDVPTPLPNFGNISEPCDDSMSVKLVGTPLPTGRNPTAAFDGNMETYVGASSVGMDFGHRVTVDKIRFAPRNANNGIVAGDRYSLYVYDFTGWRNIGSMVASAEYLSFDNVEYGGVYWLKNESRGREELPFCYESGHQVFVNLWNDMSH